MLFPILCYLEKVSLNRLWQVYTFPSKRFNYLLKGRHCSIFQWFAFVPSSWSMGWWNSTGLPLQQHAKSNELDLFFDGGRYKWQAPASPQLPSYKNYLALTECTFSINQGKIISKLLFFYVFGLHITSKLKLLLASKRTEELH